ncbi:MAG: hypothetical protein ACI9AR_000059, partial [Flavobacteriaceae bacterium]
MNIKDYLPSKSMQRKLFIVSGLLVCIVIVSFFKNSSEKQEQDSAL